MKKIEKKNKKEKKERKEELEEKKKNSKKSQIKGLLRLLKYMFEHNKILTVLVIIFILLSTLGMVRGTMFTKELMDNFIVPSVKQYKLHKSIDYSLLLAIISKMIAVYGFAVICSYIYGLMMIYIAQGTLKSLRDDVFVNMESLPIKFFDTNAHGDIMSVYSTDIDTLRAMMVESLSQVISSIVTIIGVLISMFILNVTLTFFVVFMIIVMIFTTKEISKRSSKNYVAQQKNIGAVNGYVEEMIEGLRVVKVFSYEEEANKNFEKYNEELFKSADKAMKYANILGPAVGNLGNINFVLTAVIGSIIVYNNIAGFTLGGLVSFLQFIKVINQPVSQIAQQLTSVILAAAGAQRVFELLDQVSEKDEGYVKLINVKIDEHGNITEVKEHTGKWAWKHPHSDGTVTYTKLLGDVVFENVTFGYNENKTVLHNINLFAKPGQKIAFVGATGAGKTTITNLINKFYDINSGKIRYDGINIDKIHKSDLRASLGIVLQDTNLFSGTVADNIRYGKLDATDEEVRAAAKLANADYFITHLPNGYNTVLSGNGASLSQGQRQLLSIARAAIADPPVLILDEATSSIDTRTEKIVQDGMDKLMEGRTVFVIAHRLSTIKNSDVIMVLDQGKIIERGNHEELIAQKGTYYQLYTGGFENQ